jgi:8-hydroxy-5-deazaflavin:NADPH oxidoreductase
MKIGILGSGIVGKTLALAFKAEKYEVMIAARSAANDALQHFVSENPGIQAGDFATTAKFADVVVLAVKGDVAVAAIEISGTHNVANKVIIDATNPIAAGAPVDGVLPFFTDYNQSLLEILQAKVPAAKFVKAFSSLGNAYMYKPNFNGTLPTMFIAGNDEGAKEIVTQILSQFGWETADMGKAAAARAIEPLCILWCLPSFTKNKWNHAFKLLQV